MSFTLLGILQSQAGAGGFDYWIASMGYGGRYYGIEMAEDGNVIAVGYNNDGADNVGIITKFNINGKVLWHKEFVDTNSINFEGLCTDGTNYYTTGTVGSSPQRGQILKFDTDGNQIWVRQYNETHPFGPGFRNIFYSPPDDLLIVPGFLKDGGAGGSGDNDSALTIVDPSNGNVTANRMFGRDVDDSVKGWAYSPTDNMSIVTGNIFNGAFKNAHYYSEPDGSNNRYSDYYYAGSIGNSGGYMNSVVFDYQNRMIVTGKASSQSGMCWFRSSTSRATWLNTGARSLGFDGHSGQEIVLNAAKDTAYITGDEDIYRVPVTSGDGVNPSGTFLRKLTNTYLWNMAIDETNNAIWVVGRVNTAEEPFIARIPLDGSLTGFSGTLAGQTISYSSASVYFVNESSNSSQSPQYNTNSNVNDYATTITFQNSSQNQTLEGIA